MITENDITYSEGVQVSRDVMCQDIIYKGQTIGAEGTYFEHNVFKQNRYWCQKLALEEDKHNTHSKDWDYSEDEGFIYLLFDNLQKLLDYINNKISTGNPWRFSDMYKLYKERQLCNSTEKH